MTFQFDSILSYKMWLAGLALQGADDLPYLTYDQPLTGTKDSRIVTGNDIVARVDELVEAMLSANWSIHDECKPTPL